MRKSLETMVAAYAVVLALYAGQKPQARHYPSGVFHGYLMSVSDRPDRASKQMMREVFLTARDAVQPYSLYGMRLVNDSPGKYRLIRAQYTKDDLMNYCLWNSSGTAPSGAKQCTTEEVREYSGMLDHAIEDVVR